MADEKCPICHNFIISSRGVRGSQGIDTNGDPLPFWTEDPLLTPLGLAGEDYKGVNPRRVVCIKELQLYYTSLALEANVTINEFTDITKDKPIRNVYIEELRIVVEAILTTLGKTIVDYFKYDRQGNDTGGTQQDWTDVDRDQGYPALPKGRPIRAIYIEELRRGLEILVVLYWIERWRPVISFISIPPSNPSKDDRYIVGESPSGAFEYLKNCIVNWNGSVWVPTSPTDSRYVLYVTALSNWYTYNSGTEVWDLTDRSLNIYVTPNDTEVDDSLIVDVTGDYVWYNYTPFRIRASSNNPSGNPSTNSSSVSFNQVIITPDTLHMLGSIAAQSKGSTSWHTATSDSYGFVGFLDSKKKLVVYPGLYQDPLIAIITTKIYLKISSTITITGTALTTVKEGTEFNYVSGSAEGNASATFRFVITEEGGKAKRGTIGSIVYIKSTQSVSTGYTGYYSTYPNYSYIYALDWESIDRSIYPDFETLMNARGFDIRIGKYGCSYCNWVGTLPDDSICPDCGGGIVPFEYYIRGTAFDMDYSASTSSNAYENILHLQPPHMQASASCSLLIDSIKIYKK